MGLCFGSTNGFCGIGFNLELLLLDGFDDDLHVCVALCVVGVVFVWQRRKKKVLAVVL